MLTSYNKIKLAQLTLGKIFDTPLGHKQFLCKVDTSDVFHKSIEQTQIMNFFNDLERS